MLSKRYESTEVDRRSWLYMCPRGNSGPPAVTLTKWLKLCVHARYMKVLSVTVSLFKRRMEKKLEERREKWGAMHRLVVSFWTVLDGLMLLYMYYMEGGGVWWSSPREILVECVQNCDILDQLWRKTLPTWTVSWLSFFTLGYWNGIEIITNYFDN